MDTQKQFEIKMQDLKAIDSLLIMGFASIGFGAYSHNNTNTEIAFFTAIAITALLIFIRRHKKNSMLKSLKETQKRKIPKRKS